MKKDINNYYKYHKYYLTEWNANIKAKLYLDKFLDELIKIDQNVINKRINVIIFCEQTYINNKH